MADKQEFEIDGKQINQLRVVDLKQELEKRGLSKSGSKKELVDRLKTQLQLENLQQAAYRDEGHVPNLGLQDDAIAEQSDVIKEYLAKQQEIFEIQKAARRLVEMEELKGQTNEPDSASGEQQQSSEAEANPEVNEEQEGPSTLDTQASSVTRSSSSPDEKQHTSLHEPKDPLDMKKEIRETSNVRESSSKQGDMTSKDQKPEGKIKENPDRSASIKEEKQSFKDNKHNPETAVPISEMSDISAEKSDKSNHKETKTTRRRIKREFFLAEGLKDSSKSARENVTESPISEKVLPCDSDASQSNMESKLDISQDSWAEQETGNSDRGRERTKHRRNSRDEVSSQRSNRSRSNSSSSSSSTTRGTPKRKGSSRASSTSRSSSDENSKSPKRTRVESNSVSSSESPEKGRRSKSLSPKSNLAENDTQDSFTKDKKNEKLKEDNSSDHKGKESSTASHSRFGELNDESMDVDAKTEEEAFERQESGNGKDDENKQAGRVHVRKISLSSSKEGSNKENVEALTDGEKPIRKRKWGSASSKAMKKTTFTISTDSLKTIIPDVKPVPTVAPAETLDSNDAASEQDEQDPSASKDLRILRTVTQDVTENPESEVLETEQVKPENKTIPFSKPLYLMEEPIGRHRSPSPARNPASRIIHIRNLVRPFTLNQLKDLLARTGKLVESGFWIDKIKSKCYATYETIEQAVATRQSLHGTQWPPSNRKNLIVDFADEDELYFHMSLTDTVEVPKREKVTEPLPKEIHKRLREPAPSQSYKPKESEPPLPPPIREWDRVKIGEHSPGEKERRKQAMTPPREKRRERNRELRERRERKERRKEEDEAPAKLLDDLFKKTKTTPCIYWLPLTAEQIKQKEEERKQRQLEREKRRQLLKKEESEKKPASSRDTKKAKVEDGNHHRKRSSAPSSSHSSRNRKR